VAAKKSVLDKFFFGVKIVNDCVCVSFVAGCENHKFKRFGKLPQYLFGERSNVDWRQHLIVPWKDHRYLDLVRFRELLETVYKCFIKIEDHSYFA